MRAPSAVLFDAYGTLFDVYSVSALAELFFPGHGAALATLWRDKQIEYTRLVTISNDGAHYRPFSELTLAGLRYAGRRLGLELAPNHEAALMDQYFHLEAFAEAREVLAALRAQGVATGIQSNGDRWYGFRTLWINRQGLPFETLGTQPERIGSDLRDVMGFFAAP